MQSSYWPRRIARHLVLAVLAATLTTLFYLFTAPPDIRHRASMATAYSSLVFLVATLAIGPWNIIRRHPNPVSFDLRRDLGIWAGLLAILHTAIGLTVHLRGRMWMYFFKNLHPVAFQTNQFGAANTTGLISTLLFLLLLILSNDLSLRALGLKRWKFLQSWTYIAVGLAVVHGILYQLIEKRRIPWVYTFSALTLTLIAIQFAGILHQRNNLKNQSKKPA
jgi:methionine sulfoxide reductase heme-binding subunit